LGGGEKDKERGGQNGGGGKREIEKKLEKIKSGFFGRRKIPSRVQWSPRNRMSKEGAGAETQEMGILCGSKKEAVGSLGRNSGQKRKREERKGEQVAKQGRLFIFSDRRVKGEECPIFLGTQKKEIGRDEGPGTWQSPSTGGGFRKTQKEMREKKRF